MFKIFINDGTQPPPTDDIYYIVCKEGVYLKKKVGIMESITHVKNISVLNSIEKTAKIHVPPIPKEVTIQVTNFFKEVYEKFSSEGNVLLFYDQEKREHIPFVPKQEVAGASVDYDKAIVMEGCQVIGTIHSHANFSAFHSGVDDADEAHFDGLHITIGNVMDETPSISASIVSNGTRFKVDPLEYMAGIKKVKEVDEVVEAPVHGARYYACINGKMVEQKGPTHKVKHYDKRFAIEGTPEEIEALKNPAWINNVSKKSYTSHMPIGKIDKNTSQFGRGFVFQRGGGGYSYNPSPYFRDWDGMGYGYGYDEWFDAVPTPYASPTIGTSTNSKSDKENDKNKFEINPCKHCCYLDKKLEYVIELLEAQWPELSDEFEDIRDQNSGYRINENGDAIETFCCESCNTLIETDSYESVMCPNCKNDVYLVEVDNEDIPKYIKSGAKLIKYSGKVFDLEETEDGAIICKEEIKPPEGEVKSEETYSTEEGLIEMSSRDSGDIKPECSDIFLKYITNEIKSYKSKNKLSPHPSNFKNRLTGDSIKQPKIPFSGSVTPLKEDTTKTPKITYIKRDKK